MRPRQVIITLEDLVAKRQGHLCRDGVVLTDEDSKDVREVFQQWILLLLDLEFLSLEKLPQLAGRILDDLFRLDLLDSLGKFAESLSCIINNDIKEEVGGFEALCSALSPHLFPLLRDAWRRCLLGDVVSARSLIQVFSYPSRLTLRDIDLTEQCLEAYMSTESGIVDPPPFIVKRLNRVIRRWMKGFDDSDLFFRHGPGASAGLGRTSLENKYRNLSSDALIRYAFPGFEPFPAVPAVFLERTSQTIFVPKSYKTFRTISMEPPTLMYTQQGVWGEIKNLTYRNRYLFNRFDFDNGWSRNKELARSASLDRRYATIDLSAASDSVSWSLAKGAFRGTKLLRYLVATRSRRTLLPDGRLIDLKKFAPMGSALCFPVETIIFASICEISCREGGVPGDYRVFGDDLIVPSSVVPRLLYYLGALGFSVNESKSYWRDTCWYRESCGGEYVDGYDVSPLRISRRFSKRNDSVSISGCADMANRSREYGFRYLRCKFITYLEDAGVVPFFGDSGLNSDFATNYQAKRRFNRALQRDEVRVTTPVVSYATRVDDIAYRHWLESNRLRKSLNDAFVSETGRSTVTAKLRWRSLT